MFDLSRFDLALFEESAGRAATLLRLLGNEKRLMLLCQLADGELSVRDIQTRVGLSQSALSQHLALLREEGIVATRRESQTIYYRIVDHAAMRVIETLAPDVVLLDLHMPGCSGWEVLEMIGRLPAPPPVLVMSADTRVQVIERAQALGAAGFLCKPLEVQEVLDNLRDVASGAAPCTAL